MKYLITNRRPVDGIALAAATFRLPFPDSLWVDISEPGREATTFATKVTVRSCLVSLDGNSTRIIIIEGESSLTDPDRIQKKVKLTLQSDEAKGFIGSIEEMR